MRCCVECLPVILVILVATVQLYLTSRYGVLSADTEILRTESADCCAAIPRWHGTQLSVTVLVVVFYNVSV